MEVRRCHHWLHSHTIGPGTVVHLSSENYNLVDDEFILSVFVQVCGVTSMFIWRKQPLAVLRTDRFCPAIEMVFAMPSPSIIETWSRTSRSLKGPVTLGISFLYLAEVYQSAENVLNDGRFT